MDPKNLNQLLEDYGDHSLRTIVRQSHRLQALDQLIQSCLPDNLGEHCQAAHITATTLTLIIDSAAWLTRLRYLKPQLLEQLRQHPQCVYLREINFKIHPTKILEQPENPEPKRIELSLGAKELLRSTADGLNHPLLKKSLLKLAD